MSGKLYLIPTTLGDFKTVRNTIPESNFSSTGHIKHFIVENVRTARRFLAATNHPVSIDELTFYELGKHTPPSQIDAYLEKALQGEDTGLLSEAGTPCIADPGATIVKMAHEKSIEVVPLVGPNSIILALMASGFNGQHFVFNGYLPVDKSELTEKIKSFEAKANRYNQTQIFIETPFRNRHLLSTLLSTCHPNTMLCVGINLTLPGQEIISKPISKWKSTAIDVHKKPAVYLLYKS